jgi:hypothetical protein
MILFGIDRRFNTADARNPTILKNSAEDSTNSGKNN